MVYYIPMIIGGLGNIMFQIFSIMGLARRDNVEFKIDLSKADYTVTKQLTNSDNITYLENFFNIKDFIIEKVENHIIIKEENKRNFYNNIKNHNKNIVFNGYFQDYYYLDFIKKDILKYLNFKENPDYTKYNLDNAFFIHHRRGDYVNNSFHDIINENYYKEALKYFPKDATIIICSNEKNYGLDFYPDRKVIFIDENEIDTLDIMRRTKYGGIVANSSFSWWGSYLNESSDKIITMPSRWFSIKSDVSKYHYPGVKVINV